MSPGEQSHVPVRLIRESSQVLVAPIPFDDERNLVVPLLRERVDVVRAPCGFFAVEVRLGLRCRVRRACVVLCAARSTRC